MDRLKHVVAPQLPASLSEKWKCIHETSREGREILRLAYLGRGIVISFR